MERGKERRSGADDGGSHERVIAAEATGNAGGAEAEEAEARGAGGAKAPLLLLATRARRRRWAVGEEPWIQGAAAAAAGMWEEEI